MGAYAGFVIFGKGVWNCDEVKWSGQRSPEVAKDLATLTQFQTVLHGLLSFLSHLPSHQGAWLNSPAPTTNSDPVVAAAAEGCGGRLGMCSEKVCAALAHIPSLAIGNVASLLPWAFLPVFAQCLAVC